MPPVAVEVHVSGGSPLGRLSRATAHATRIKKRIEYLADRGWFSVYVWISDSFPLTEGAADEIVTLYKIAQRDLASLGKYRVIRGSGERAVVLRKDTHHRP